MTRSEDLLPLVLVPAAVLSGLLILLSVRALGRGT